MREILFRGKRKDNGEWVYGSLVHIANYCAIIQHDQDNLSVFDQVYLDCELGTIDGMGTIVIPETVGQYTGFVDKFMRKIYEGDIIKTKFGRECVVEWFSSPAYRGWDLRIIDSSANSNIPSPTLYDLYANYNLEIVNNIHDLPKELKEVVK